MKTGVNFQHSKARECIVRENVSFAQFAGLCGLTSGHLSLLMNGKRQPSAPVRRRLLKGISEITGREWKFEDFFEVVERDAQ